MPKLSPVEVSSRYLQYLRSVWDSQVSKKKPELALSEQEVFLTIPASFDEEALRLEPGDLIVAFSDGVSEALNEAGEEFTDDRLLACLAANRTGTPQQILDSLLKDVRAFCGDAPQSDDVTIVMMRYDG